MKQESQWDQLSHSLHWRNRPDEAPEKKKLLESELRLKTILTDGYFGRDGVLRPKKPSKQLSKSVEPFYQSSRRLDFKNFALSKREEEDAERIRERNIDRLKLLQQYEED